MNRNWTPESRVSVTEAGMVIEIKLSAIQAGSVDIFVDAGQLCVRGQHDNFGPFETRFDVTSDLDLANARSTFTEGILRIEVPMKDKSSGSKVKIISDPKSFLAFFLKQPHEMLIYCNGCGKHFDIVVTGKGPKDYRCPACGKVQAFDLEALANKAIAQGKQMLKKRRGRR
jgi:hypothetical protein